MLSRCCVADRGELHGPSLTAILEGLPAGVPVTGEAIRRDLARRRLGVGRGSRQKFEQDELGVVGGVVHGRTIGGPIALTIGNTEWPKWSEVMNAEDVPLTDASRGRAAPLTRPRPGHADLTGMQKYGFDEARPVLERASARETAARVALGAVARAFLASSASASSATSSPSVRSRSRRTRRCPGPEDVDRIDEDPVRCADPATSALMVAEIDDAHHAGDTLGGVVEVVVEGLPPGLGSYVHGDRKLDARLAAALMGIQAIKGVEIGDGFRTAARRGSAAHDELVREARRGRIERVTDRAGGIEGGMSTGEVLRVRAAMKPISTVPHALRTVDVATGEAASAHHQRRTSAPCRLPASSRRRWSRSCSPTPSSRSSAATRSPRRAATSRPTSPRSPPALRTAAAAVR